MHDIFRDCDPVKLSDTALNSLSWADDLLLLSLSKEGLQKCLNNLREYCQKWALTVNGEKTKVMILSKGKSVKANITFGTNEIECVNNFHYLGFQISHDMQLKTIIEDRHSKAKKCQKWYFELCERRRMYQQNYWWVCLTNRSLLSFCMARQYGYPIFTQSHLLR